MVKVFAFIGVMLFSCSVFAGTFYEAWGEDPGQAMEKALNTAKSSSKGGCLCKGWSPNMEELCRKGLGGWICKACGSNHKGSCASGSDVERYYGDAKKLKDLLVN